MKKIMFEHRRFGLEQAVIARLKEMTRRKANFPKGVNDKDVESAVRGIDKKGRVFFTFRVSTPKGMETIDVYPKYQIGDEVAVAQAYRDIRDIIGDIQDGKSIKFMAGWNNKMFVKAEYMPRRIRITDIKAERLQDISDEDCMKEGIIPITWRQWHKQDIDDFSPQRYTDHHLWTLPLFREGIEDPWADEEPEQFAAESANVAFAVLIMKLHGKKAWQRNEWQFAYTFKLIK